MHRAGRNPEGGHRPDLGLLGGLFETGTRTGEGACGGARVLPVGGLVGGLFLGLCVACAWACVWPVFGLCLACVWRLCWARVGLLSLVRSRLHEVTQFVVTVIMHACFCLTGVTRDRAVTK